MPRRQTRIAPGTVRFRGPAKVLRIAGPSGKAYFFRCGEDTIVAYADWDWIESISDGMRRFERISPPAPSRTEVPVEAVEVVQPEPTEAEAEWVGFLQAEVLSDPEPAVTGSRKRGNRARDLPVEVGTQN